MRCKQQMIRFLTMKNQNKSLRVVSQRLDFYGGAGVLDSFIVKRLRRMGHHGEVFTVTGSNDLREKEAIIAI